jgi:iron complex outermembrane receptor protein
MNDLKPRVARVADSQIALGRLVLTATAAACAAILSVDFAAAQDDEEPQSRELDELVVTARFREESLQETPLAITAISGETLSENGATTVIDIADWAPNVVMDQLGSGWGPTLAASVRGLGYGDFKATSEPTVTIYVDDVVLGRPTAATLDLLDLERVEVLRGPQGTLFGKNAIGGVVRMISRKPGEGDTQGDVELTVGTYDRLDVRGSFETALIEETLFARVSYASKRREGWQDNVDFRCDMLQRGTPQLAGLNDGIVGWTRDPDGPTGNDPNNTIPAMGGPGAPILGAVGSAADNAFALPTSTSTRGTDRNCVVGRFGDENIEAARGILRFVPNDRFELNLAADITDQEATSPYDLLESANPATGLNTLFNNSVALPTWGVPYDQRFVPGPGREDVNYSGFGTVSGIDSDIDTPNMNDFSHWGVSSTFDWYLDNLSVKLILAYREFDAQWGRDSDASTMPINHTLDTFRDEQDTAEFRVSGQIFDERTEWTVGLYYFNADDFNSNISVLFPCLLGTSCIDRVDTQNTENTGVFINTVTDLTDRLSLTVGLRQTDDEKHIVQERFDRTGIYCCGFQAITPVIAESSETDPMLSISYDVGESMMVYGTYQEGFRGGGTTARPTATTRVAFGPETLDNLEVGIKSDLLDGRVRVNASYYSMTYEDMQINSAGLDQNNQPAWVTSNAGSADITGFEIEMQSNIGQHWLLDATIGHTNFQYTDVPDLQDCLSNGFPAVSCTGFIDIDSAPARTPDYTVSLSAAYMTSFGNGSQFSVRVGASYQDDTYFGPNELPLELAPAYTLVNARITWISADNSWEAALFGTNITDERAIQSKLNFLNLFGTMETTYVRPEEWATSIRKRF